MTARTHADQLHNQDKTNLMVDYIVPLTELWWTYQKGDADIQYLHHDHLFARKNTKKLSHSY